MKSGSFILERASMSHPSMHPDDVTRAIAADAPLYVKRAMDMQREARGLPLLWGHAVTRAAAAAAMARPTAPARKPGATSRVQAPPQAPTRQNAPAARNVAKPPARAVKPAAPTDCYFLAGAVAPGTSVPVAVGREGLVMRERMHPRAFDASLAEIDSGRKVVTLRDGHEGPVVATTANGTLTFEVKPMVGLVMTARVGSRTYSARAFADTFAKRTGLSAAFHARRVAFEKDARGRNVRVVHEAELDHVALVRPDNGQPAYRTRVVAVAATKANARTKAMSAAMVEGMRITLAQLSGET